MIVFVQVMSGTVLEVSIDNENKGITFCTSCPFSLDELKPIAAEERRVEEEEKKVREEKERIAKAIAEGSLLLPLYTCNIGFTLSVSCCIVKIDINVMVSSKASVLL